MGGRGELFFTKTHPARMANVPTTEVVRCHPMHRYARRHKRSGTRRKGNGGKGGLSPLPLHKGGEHSALCDGGPKGGL